MIPLFCQTGFSTRVKIKNNIIYRRSNSRNCEYVNKSFFAFLIKCFLIGISKRVRKEVIPFYPQRIFLINQKKILFPIISTKKKKLSTSILNDYSAYESEYPYFFGDCDWTLILH